MTRNSGEMQLAERKVRPGRQKEPRRQAVYDRATVVTVCTVIPSGDANVVTGLNFFEVEVANPCISHQ